MCENVFLGNRAARGGALLGSCNPLVHHNIFMENIATGWIYYWDSYGEEGGGILCGPALLASNTFFRNEARPKSGGFDPKGGAIYVDFSDPEIVNNLIVCNEWGGIYAGEYASNVYIHHNNLWGECAAGGKT